VVSGDCCPPLVRQMLRGRFEVGHSQFGKGKPYYFQKI